MLRFSKSLAAVFLSAVFAVIAFMLVASSAAQAQLIIGGDVSEAFSASAYQCLKDSYGWNAVVVRAYRNFGQPDPNAPGNLLSSAQAGIQYRDIYVFPCRSVAPSTIASQTLANTPVGTFGSVWLDIEMNPSSGCGWGGGAADCEYLQGLIQAFQNAGATVGIYSSYGEWPQTVGSSCTVGAANSIPLWWARYDGASQPSSVTQDFISFGGWTASSGLIVGRQYSDSINGACGVSADADIFVGGSGPTPPSPPSPGSSSSGSYNPPPPPPPAPGSSSSGSGGCLEFFEGLCPGASNCLCTLGETCGNSALKKIRNATRARNANGGCSGSCMTVAYGDCGGDSYCLKPISYC